MIKEGKGVASATWSLQDLTRKVSKTCKYIKQRLRVMDLKTVSTIQLCLTDEVMYNVMDEEITTELWSRLEMHMMKSLSNKLYLKKQLYGLRVNEGITELEHLNFFNKIINKLLVVNVKIDKEDETLILLSSLSQS